MSWQSRVACWLLERQFRPETENPHASVERARARTAARIWSPRVPAGWRFIDSSGRNHAPLAGEWLEPIADMARAAPLRTLLYLHGGGYYFCSPKSHRSLVFPLAVRTGARTFSLDYRLAPEHPFPAALDDALAAYRQLVRDGTPPESIVVAGDALPAAGLLFSPWTDLAATGATLVSNDGLDPMFRGAAIARAARFYLGTTSPTHPYASPLYADLTGLPPLLIQVGSTEVLLDDARRVAERARAVQVEVDFEIWPKMPHVWQLFVPFIPEGRAALERAAAFACRHAKACRVQPRAERSIAS